MEKIQDFTIHFYREIRTPSSEMYTIFYLNNNSESEATKIGTFNVHIASTIYGVLVLVEELGNREISLIVEEIRDQILSSLEANVSDPTGTYIEVYSNCDRVEDLDWSALVNRKNGLDD